MWVIYIVCFYIFYILLTQPFNPLQSLIVGVLFFIFMFKAHAQAETPSEPVGPPRTSLQ